MITKADMDFADNSKDDSKLIVFLKFSGFNGEWPTTIERNGKQYIFEGQEPVPGVMASNYCGCAKYMKDTSVISAQEQKDMLDRQITNIEEFRNLPYGLKISDEQFNRRSSNRYLGNVSECDFSDFIDKVRELADESNVDPDDVKLEFDHRYVTISALAYETDQDIIRRLNKTRTHLLKQYFQKLQSQQRAVLDKLDSDRKAYRAYASLQKKFANYTPEQIAALNQ